MKVKLPENVLKPVAALRGGIKVSHNKFTSESETRRIEPPPQVVIPMVQHIGAPCTPLVKAGERVLAGQKIGDTDAYISAPIHASVSGKVKAVAPAVTVGGRHILSVTIENDGLMEYDPSIAPPKVESQKDFIKAVRASGLVGLGGAGFPAHAKLNFPKDVKIDTLIVNAAECEPYITTDYRECIENSWDIVSGIHALIEFFDFKRVVIAVEDNKPEAIKILSSIADTDNERGDRIHLMALKSKYPQGAEKAMIRTVTGRKVPPGKLPADVGCAVMNVGSVAFIARYLKSGRPLISRTITCSGSAIAQPSNIRVPIGTSAKEIVAACGGYAAEPYKIIVGGPMMGFALYDDEVPLTKQNNALLAFASKEKEIKKERACIRCGRCVAACPMSLAPVFIADKLKKDPDPAELNELGAMVCMECGSCAYVCPAGKPLVQSMRRAKDIVREGMKK
ncbi:MAG: electron transport complex subunit RsxC [Clostridia bacterium]|nr:electron transport complex subunit RsxC [Clostridia bacterium]